MKIHRTFEVFLYGLTLLVYAFGLVFARKEGAFSLSFLFFAIVVFLWQYSMYRKIQAADKQRTFSIFDLVLCMVFDCSILPVMIPSSIWQFDSIFQGLFLTFLLLYANHAFSKQKDI